MIDNKCEGVCRAECKCTGEVKRVHVVAQDGYDWGEFNYCDSAIKCDRDAGFKIKIIEV